MDGVDEADLEAELNELLYNREYDTDLSELPTAPISRPQNMTSEVYGDEQPSPATA